MSITSITLPEKVADQGADFPDSQAGQWVSEADYWQTYYHDPDFTYEWNNGILEVKPMPDYLNFTVYLWFVKLLDQFLERYPIARPVGLEMGFSLQLPHKSTGRRPDLGVVLNNNPVPLADKDHKYQGIFDLCVESLSDSGSKEIKRDTVEKKSEYALAGVKEYYILDETGQHTAFYVLRQPGVYGRLHPTAEGVIQSRVLSGFQFRLTDLYRRPRFVTLADDPVYQEFILPEYQAAAQRAKAAEEQAKQEQERAETAEQQAKQQQERAEAAEQRAETAEQRAERYAAKLKELGLSLD